MVGHRRIVRPRAPARIRSPGVVATGLGWGRRAGCEEGLGASTVLATGREDALARGASARVALADADTAATGRSGDGLDATSIGALDVAPTAADAADAVATGVRARTDAIPPARPAHTTTAPAIHASARPRRVVRSVGAPPKEWPVTVCVCARPSALSPERPPESGASRSASTSVASVRPEAARRPLAIAAAVAGRS